MYTAKNATLQKTKQIKWKKNQNKKGVIFISISFGYAYEKNLRYYNIYESSPNLLHVCNDYLHKTVIPVHKTKKSIHNI